LRARAAQDERPFFAISAVAGKGVRELLIAIARELDQIRADVTSHQSHQAGESLLVGSGPSRY